MICELVNPIASRQHTVWCLLFLFALSTHPGLHCGKHKIYQRPFKWFEFERGLDNIFFCNFHRMDQPSFYALHKAMLLALLSRHTWLERVCLPLECMLSMTLSYLGRASICNLMVLHQPLKKGLIFMHAERCRLHQWNGYFSLPIRSP